MLNREVETLERKVQYFSCFKVLKESVSLCILFFSSAEFLRFNFLAARVGGTHILWVPSYSRYPVCVRQFQSVFT
jgi:hypothetical protein